MEGKTILILGGAGIVAYYLYQQAQNAVPVATVNPVTVPPALSPAATTPASTSQVLANQAATTAAQPSSVLASPAKPTSLASMATAIQALAANDANLINGAMSGDQWNFYANLLLGTSIPAGWTSGGAPVTFAQWWAQQAPVVTAWSGLSGLGARRKVGGWS